MSTFSDNDVLNAVIDYSIQCGIGDDGLEFLRCWREGNFEAIRKEWPDAPEIVFCQDLETLEAAACAVDVGGGDASGSISVPIEAPVGLLASMAMRHNHGFGLLERAHQLSILRDMKKIHEEVVGKGFWNYKDPRPIHLALALPFANEIN